VSQGATGDTRPRNWELKRPGDRKLRDGETRRQREWETRAKGDRTPREQDTGGLERQETI